MSLEPLTKPARGTALLERRERVAKHQASEKATMRKARIRDGSKCRVPFCPFEPRKLTIDVAHRVHRGMGGNPKLDRTTLDGLICLCRIHHGQYDAAQLDIEPLSPEGFSGPCEFSRLTEGGRMEVFAAEARLRVSVERSVR